MRLTVVFLLIFNFIMLRTAVGDNNIQQTIIAFYNIYLEVRPLGVPTEKEREKLKLHISTTLRQLLQEADAAEQEYYKATGGEVPPLVESDLFTSLFEGATAFNVLSCESRPDTASCRVEFSYNDPGNQYTFRWQDNVYLVRENHGWLVDDIEYLGDWQFMHKGRLQELLRQVIEDGNNSQE